jgi:hypothetical protein
MIDSIYYKELNKLAEGLNERGFDYFVCPLQDGLQIICRDWVAIYYGHENGLLAVVGLPYRDDDDFIGYLTAEQVLEMVDEFS